MVSTKIVNDELKLIVAKLTKFIVEFTHSLIIKIFSLLKYCFITDMKIY